MNPAIHRQTIFRAGPSVKRSALLSLAIRLAVFFLFFGGRVQAVSPGAPIHEEELEAFSEENYRTAVENLFVAFEAEQERDLEPGERGRVGLKVSTVSGPGLSTPRALVRGVIASLVARGFEEKNIFLIDQSEQRLRQAGFLPPLGVAERDFEGHPVYVLESGRWYDPIWYYESPLPPRRGNFGFLYEGIDFNPGGREENRRSYLPAPLLLEVDFWINLPACSDHPVLGINGALLNATFWNASNTARFTRSDASGAAAAAEMAAIPELEERWLFSILSLELYQVAGGPFFRSLYTESIPRVLLSADPVALDSRMYRKINEGRENRNLPRLKAGERLLDYAEQLNLGKIEVKND